MSSHANRLPKYTHLARPPAGIVVAKRPLMTGGTSVSENVIVFLSARVKAAPLIAEDALLIPNCSSYSRRAWYSEEEKI